MHFAPNLISEHFQIIALLMGLNITYNQDQHLFVLHLDSNRGFIVIQIEDDHCIVEGYGDLSKIEKVRIDKIVDVAELITNNINNK